jgi:hypothetical protein
LSRVGCIPLFIPLADLRFVHLVNPVPSRELNVIHI